MPTTIYDSSLLTQRRRDKAVAQQVFNANRLAVPIIIPQAGYGSYLLGEVENGNITYYRKGEGCTDINVSCNCISILPNIPVYLYNWDDTGPVNGRFQWAFTNMSRDGSNIYAVALNGFSSGLSPSYALYINNINWITGYKQLKQYIYDSNTGLYSGNLRANDTYDSIQKSLDNGINFTAIPNTNTDTGGSIETFVASLNGQYIYLSDNEATSDSYIYRLNNNDNSFTRLDSANTYNWQQFSCSEDGQYVYAISNGGTHRSTNYGVNWDVYNSLYGDCITCSYNGSIIYIGNNNIIRKSTDYGANFSDIHDTDGYIPISISCSQDGNIVYYVNSTTIYKSDDEGTTWNTVGPAAPSNSSWTSIKVSQDASVISVCSSVGLVYISRDSGDTWVVQDIYGTKPWQAVAISSTDIVVALPSGEYPYNYNNGAWIQLVTAPALRWSLIVYASGEIFIAGTNDDYLYKSIDNGASWVQINNDTHQWVSIASSSNAQIIGAIGSGSVYLTLDGGSNWSIYSLIDTAIIQISEDGSKIYVLSNGDLFILQGGSFVSLNVPYSLSNFTISADGSIIVGISNNQIIKSINSGITWDIISTVNFLISSIDSSIVSSSDCNILAAISNSNIYVSKDGGYNWTIQPDISDISSISITSLGDKIIASQNGGTVLIGTI